MEMLRIGFLHDVFAEGGTFTWQDVVQRAIMKNTNHCVNAKRNEFRKEI